MVSEQLTELSLNGCPCNSTQINWESWTTACKSMKLEHTLTPCTKINSNGLRANIRQDLVKLLQESRSKTLSNINHTTGFLGQSPKAIDMKIKTNKWGLIRLMRFCTAKETITKQPMEWEKIFANHISNKGLISTLYKEFIQSNSKTPNDTMGKAP